MNLNFKRLLLAAASLLLIWTATVSTATGQSLPKGVTRVASVEGITEYRLPNGLRVLLFPDPTKQTITVNITYLVGSKHENYGETGMAHLLEHLVFKGSPKHANIPQELTEHGARPNGTTWYDRTNYFETFAATEENLRWALDLESDRMVNSYIAKKDLDSEMTVVRNEFESGENSPFRVLLDRVFSTSYLWHNYGKSTIGARSDIENVPIDRLQAFYRKYYQPDNAVLLVAGKLDEAKTLGLIDQYFSPISKPAREIPKIYTVDPVQDGERQVTVRRVGDTQLAMVAYRIPAGAHPDSAGVNILGQVIADTPSGRLHKALVETKKASGVFAFPAVLGDPGLLLFGAEVRLDQSLDGVRETMLQVIEEIMKTPPTAEEVERARAQLLKEIDLQFNSSERIGLELSEWIGMGDWRLLFLNRDLIKKVTVAEVQKVAASYLKQSNRTLGLFIPTAKPDRSEIPATPDILALVKDYKGEAKISMGEAFDPSPANIDTRTKRFDRGGVKLSLLTKQTRGNAVVASLSLHFGDEKSLMNRGTAGDLAASMLMRGTAKRTRQQIQDELDKLKARMMVGGGSTGVTVTIQTVRENLPAVLAIANEVLREPSFPQSEFDQLVQEQLAGIEQQRSEPTQQAALAISRHLTPYPKGHVRYVSTPDEDIAELKAAKLDDAKKFYADFFGLSNAELAVVGDFDEKVVQEAAEKMLSGWKNKQPFVRIPEKFQEIGQINQNIGAPDKANAFFIAGQNLKLSDQDADYPALLLGNYMLGGGFLNSRLAVRIRQKEGLSYGVGSQFMASSLDQSGRFTAFAIYAPQNRDKLEAAFKEEIEKALKDGFTADEVKAAKSGWLQSRQVSRAQDNELVNRLRSYAYLGRTVSWDAELEKKVESLTPEQITAAMRRHLDLAKISIVKAGDFK
ncbi:MAG: M16 family metallopeptidase [Blastocatellia bacterium]|jgi:zinc protease